MGLLDGRTGIVFGVANKRSIAWAIAQALAGAGMRLAFTYQGDRLRENVEALAGTLPGSVIYPCDVASDGEIGAVFAGVARDLGRLDTLVTRWRSPSVRTSRATSWRPRARGSAWPTTSPRTRSSGSCARQCRCSRSRSTGR